MLNEFHDAFLKSANLIATNAGIDFLSDFPEFGDRLVVAADGHYHQHAVHAEKTASGKYISPGTIYMLDLHTGIISPLAIVQAEAKEHHEIKVLRNHLPALNKANKKSLLLYMIWPFRTIIPFLR